MESWGPPVLAALIGVVGAALIAHVYTRQYADRLKRIDAALEFSRRYQELLQFRHDLNKQYAAMRHRTYSYSWPGSATADRGAALNFYRRYFDLLYNETVKS